MFVRDFIHVDQPFEVVAPRFVSDTSWLAPIAEDAALVAREVALALTHEPGPASLVLVDGRGTGNGRANGNGNGNGNGHGNGHANVNDPGRAGPPGVGAVRCEVGPVRARLLSILVPMWLISVEGVALLPDLSGDLEVAPVGVDRSVIALGATYRRTSPEHEESLRVERATEAGVRTFLSGIAGYLDRPLSTV